MLTGQTKILKSIGSRSDSRNSGGQYSCIVQILLYNKHGIYIELQRQADNNHESQRCLGHCPFCTGVYPCSKSGKAKRANESTVKKNESTLSDHSRLDGRNLRAKRSALFIMYKEMQEKCSNCNTGVHRRCFGEFHAIQTVWALVKDVYVH